MPVVAVVRTHLNKVQRIYNEKEKKEQNERKKC